MLTPRLLVTHRAVLEAGTLRGAADVLGCSVSTVSHQLATLERETRQPLWERAGRGMRPTAAGLVLAEHTDRILTAIDNAESALDDTRHGRTGGLRVVTFHTAGESLLPSAIAALAQTLPGTSVHPVLDDTESALRRLRAGEVDAAIVVEFYPRGQEPADDLHRTHLFDDDYRILLHDSDPLARRRSIDVGDLSAANWIVTAGPDDYIRAATVNLCRRFGYSPRIVAEADGFSVTQGYVSVGLGVAIAPVLALGAIRRHVVVRKLKQPPPPRYIWLVTRPALAAQPPVLALTGALREASRRSW